MTHFADHVLRTEKRSITTFGDSITAGASVPEATRWANRLATRLHLSLVNKGISGTVLQGSADATGKPRQDNGFHRFRRDLLGEDRSDCVAILYGTNDARHTGAPSTLNQGGFVRDYRAVLTALIEAGFAPADIVIGSPVHLSDAGFAVGDPEFIGQSRDGYEAYIGSVRSLARDFGTFYAPVHERMTAEGGDALVLPDCVHPNPDGHAVIANAFAAATILD